MGVKKIKNILDNRKRQCSWCVDDADWVSVGTCDKKYSCQSHKENLDNHFRESPKIPREKDNGYRTEADYQTWMKL